jgi:type II secretory pathway predicted ATPase ExeA
MEEIKRISQPQLNKLGLREQPFRISADPRFLYLSRSIANLINRLLDLMEFEEGLGVVEGEIGAGKTTVARRLFDIANGDDNNLHPVFIHTATYSTAGVAAREISTHLRLPHKRSYNDQLHEIEKWILDIRSQGRNPVLIIDDAHAMSVESLDTIQNLINFDVHSKAIQIVLFGQPEIHTTFGDEAAASVNNRVVTWQLLRPFSPAEMIEMLNWRAQQAGRKAPLFDDLAFQAIYSVSEGNPRDSVNLAHESLRHLITNDEDIISEAIVQAAIDTFTQRPEIQRKNTTLD